MQTAKRIRRAKSVRKNMTGTDSRPRLSIFRSNKHLYAQLIDDVNGITILGVTDKHVENESAKKVEMAKLLGLLLAKKAMEKKIKTVIFDRGSYSYHGTVKAIAEGAREGGLQL